jgi:hypothetical protein
MESVLYKRHPIYTHLFCGDNGYIWSTKRCKFLTGKLTDGRSFIWISKAKKELGYRLVWETHVGKICHNKEINHINGISSDDRLENLEAVSHLENMRHAYALGLIRPKHGTASGNAKLTEDQAIEIIMNTKMTSFELCKNYGVSASTIRTVRNGGGWKHLDKYREEARLVKKIKKIKN